MSSQELEDERRQQVRVAMLRAYSTRDTLNDVMGRLDAADSLSAARVSSDVRIALIVLTTCVIALAGLLLLLWVNR